MRFATQYRGEELSETAAPARAIARPVSRSAEQADALRLLTPQVAAVLRKEYRYLTRNSFAFFLLIMPPVFVLLFTTQFAVRHPTAVKHPVSTEMFFPGMMAYLLLILMAPAYNSFAYDGKGIQTYFTSPVSFREVFLGKNLLQVAMLSFELTLCVVAFSYLVGIPSLPVLAATAAAIVFNISGQLTIANWSSLSFPRKLNFGQMRGQRQSGMAVLVGFSTQILLGAISAPILFMSRWTGDRWLPAEVFVFLAAAAIAGYSSSLAPLAALAEKKKEILIDALSR
jgi:ABC-2 type transport system permease protein